MQRRKFIKNTAAASATFSIVPSFVLGKNHVPPSDTLYMAGFGAGGRVTIEPGALGEGIGTYGWGGAAGTVAWVDRANNLRASGYIQNLPSEAMPFRDGVLGAVYADLQA